MKSGDWLFIRHLCKRRFLIYDSVSGSWEKQNRRSPLSSLSARTLMLKTFTLLPEYGMRRSGHPCSVALAVIHWKLSLADFGLSSQISISTHILWIIYRCQFIFNFLEDGGRVDSSQKGQNWDLNSEPQNCRADLIAPNWLCWKSPTALLEENILYLQHMFICDCKKRCLFGKQTNVTMYLFGAFSMRNNIFAKWFLWDIPKRASFSWQFNVPFQGAQNGLTATSSGHL